LGLLVDLGEGVLGIFSSFSETCGFFPNLKAQSAHDVTEQSRTSKAEPQQHQRQYFRIARVGGLMIPSGSSGVLYPGGRFPKR